MKTILCAVIIVSLLLVAGTAVAQQFGAGQQQFPGIQQGAQQPYVQPGAQQPQYGGQYGAPQQQPGVLNIPPAPEKPVPNRAYGNTERAALIGEQLSRTSQGNANVYVSENSNRTVSLGVYLLSSSDPYSIAGTMANLTYMMSSLYDLTELKGSDILLTVYDPAGNMITTARFSSEKNAFEYYNVPRAVVTATPVVQPGYGQPTPVAPTGYPQPGYPQPGYGQPAYGQPAYGGQTGMQPAYGYR